MATELDATKKIIADVQSVLYEADNALDKLRTIPTLKSYCTDILLTFSRVSPTDEDVETLEDILRTALMEKFIVDANKL